MTNRGEPGKLQYFESWASYQIPMRPVHPIAYEQSEGLSAYYLAEYDDLGRLWKFTKFVRDIVATQDLPANVVPSDGSRTSGRSYFEVAGSGQPGPNIAFPATQFLGEYFRSQVSSVDAHFELQKISQKADFQDEYEYWPNGSLRHRITHKSDGSSAETFFDERGRQVPGLVPVPQPIPH